MIKARTNETPEETKKRWKILEPEIYGQLQSIYGTPGSESAYDILERAIRQENSRLNRFLEKHDVKCRERLCDALEKS